MGARQRLLIDDSAAFNQGAGIGRYARMIVPAAVAALEEPTVTLWYAPARPGPPRFAESTLARFGDRPPRVVRSPLSRRRIDQLWFRARLPIPFEAFVGRGDVIYSPDFTAPPSPRTPRVMTVHDLAFVIRPHYTPAALRRYLAAVVPRQVATAAHVVAVSETTRRDLIERMGLDPARVTVVPNGVEELFFAADPLGDGERVKWGVPSEYVLMVGTLEPRKNHLGAFAAIERVDAPLVVVGRRGWEVEPILEAAAPLIARGKIILLDGVDDEMLARLYAGAAAVLYPSWYEGFGLPVLEALAAGAPVVASDIPALREVAADQAIFAAPARVDELAGAIERALGSDERTAERRRGRQRRARQFSWEASGRKLARVLSDVA